MEEVLNPAVGLQRGQTLDAGGDVGHEGSHGHIVQTLQFPDEDPGDGVERPEDQDQRPCRRQEPWEHTADDDEAEEDQDDVVDEHLRLERQTSVDWRETHRKSVRIQTSKHRPAGPVLSCPLPSSMSLENRVKICPVGVMSKNFMGQRRILWKSSL